MTLPEAEQTGDANSDSTTHDPVSRRQVLRTGTGAVSTVMFGGTALIGQSAAKDHQGNCVAQSETHQSTVEQRAIDSQSTEERGPVILADGSTRYFTYDLDTGVTADWEEADQDGKPVWEDDAAIHWIDTTVTDRAGDRPDLEITIYQEVVFSADCDDSGIAHPALSPSEWARVDAVSNMDPQSWLVLMAVDELKAAFDHVVWQLNGQADETPSEKYGVATTDVERFHSLTRSGTCEIELVGVNPKQVIKSGEGPLPTPRNGAVTIRVPVPDWARTYSDGSTNLGIRPHQHVADWGEVLANPSAVDLAPSRRLDKLVGRDSCDGG